MAYDLKSESEVKEYLEKLGIEYRFGCFSEKKPEVCHLLGDYLEAIKKDFEKAGKVYKNNCEEFKYSKSCYKYGKYLLVGRGQHGVGNFKKSYKYFEQGCQLGEPDSCLHQGLMLVSNNKNIDVPLDIAKGLECLEKACEGNNANACYYLSGMYIAGVLKDQQKTRTRATEDNKKPNVEYTIPKNMTRAFKYALKGCELGNMYSCANISQMYAKGDGVMQNSELAEKYKKIAMDMQEQTFEEKQSLTFQEGLGPA